VAANTIDIQSMPAHDVIPPQMQPVYSDFIKHSYLLTTGQWTNVSPLFLNISSDIMNTFLTGTAGLAIGNKLKNFRYFTSDIKITIMVQGFPLAYGKMIFYFDPQPFSIRDDGTAFHGAGSMPKNPQKCRSMIVPNICIDPSKTEIHEITLKCPTTWGVYSLDQLTGSYNFGYQIINPLLSGQTGAPPAITYSVYMSLVNPEMSVLSFTSSNFTVKEQTKISDHVGAFSKGMSMMSNIPVLGSFATLASDISATAASALSWFGFSKPVIQKKEAMGMFYTMDEQGTLDGDVHAHTLALRHDNTVTINPDNIPLCSFKDQEVEYLVNQVNFVKTFNVTTAMTSGTKIGVMYLKPENIFITDSPAVANEYEMSNFCLFTRPYEKYKADNKVRLEFVASVFHRATIVAAYFPDFQDIAISMANAVQTVKTWQFQISGNAVYDLEIPYSQPDPYLRTITGPGNNVPSSYGESNGVLVFYVLNPVISNGTGDLYLNVYMGACNLHCAIPSDNNLWRINYSTTSSGYEGLMSFDDSRLVFTSSPIAPAAKPNPLCMPDPTFYKQYFGEEMAHTAKELAGRMSSYLLITQPVAMVRSGFGYTVTIPEFPPPTTLNAAWPAIYFGVNNNVFAIISGAYVGYKGSVNYTIYPDSYVSGAKTVLAVKSKYKQTGIVGFFDTVSMWFTNESTTFATIYNDLQNFLTVKVPYYYRGMFRPTFPIQTSTTIPENCVDFVIMSNTKNQPDPRVAIFSGAGDDANFVFFRGAPIAVIS
jgi:hypothetical protein